MATLSHSRPVHDEITRDQLELLKAKFDVLQGERKAYFETYEQTKRTNEQLLKDLRERQKELGKQLAEAQRKSRGGNTSSSTSSSGSGAKGVGGPPGGVGTDDARVGEDLIKKRTEYDKLRHKTADLRAEVEKLQGELLAITGMKGLVGAAASAGKLSTSRRGSEQSGGTRGSGGADTNDDDDDGSAADASGAGGGGGGGAAQRHVRQLENRLDKTAIKHEEALSIRRTYEQIVKRLRDERVGYDTQVAAIEKTINSKNNELEELRTLAGDATRAMEGAQVELGRIRGMAAADREKRYRELRERQAMAQGRRHHAEISIARERARRDLLAEVAGDLGVSEEKALMSSVETAKARKAALTEHAALIKRKLETYEAAWRRIKDATGVSEIEEVTAKMAAQVEQHQHLASQSRDNVQRLENLRGEIESFKRFVEELRFTGGAGLLPPSSPAKQQQQQSSSNSASSLSSALTIKQEDVIPLRGDSFQELQSSLTSRAERARDDASETTLQVVQLRVGVSHLADSLAVIRATAGAPTIPPVVDENIVDVLAACEYTLDMIADKLTKYRDATGIDLLGGGEDDIEQSSSSSSSSSPKRGGGYEYSGAGEYDDRRQPSSSPARSEGGGRFGSPNANGGGAGGTGGAARPDSREGTSRLAANISPSPQQLARIGLTDTDLVAARSFNTRVKATFFRVSGSGSARGDSSGSADGGDENNGGGGYSRSNIHTPETDEVNGLLAGIGGGPEMPSGGNNSNNKNNSSSGGGNDHTSGGTLSRDAIKRVAQRSLETHRRINSRKKKGDEEEGGGGGGGAAGAAAATAVATSSSSSKGGKKMAGPPRHQY